MNKQTQWYFAGGLLCLLVFGVTFFMNYLGDASSGTAPKEDYNGDTAQLAFAARTAPPVELERGSEGGVDFWYSNPHDRPIPTGLNYLGCQCSSVDLFQVPASYRAERAAEAAGLFGEGTSPLPMALLATLVRWHATEEPAHLADEKRCTVQDLKDTRIAVPAGAVGWVRLKWKNSKVARQTLGAELWFHHAQSGPKARLTVASQYHDPLGAGTPTDVHLPGTSIAQLPQTEALYVWSYTRLQLDLKAVNVPLRDRLRADPFVVGTPVPATPEEYRRAEAMCTVLAGERPPFRTLYRIPITMNATSPDGSVSCDQGGFTRRVEISLADDPHEKLAYMVHGVVQGDLRVEGSADGLRIDLGDFHHNAGSRTETRTVATALPNLDLEIDRTRTASFLKAELTGPRDTLDGGRAWTLKVRILGKAVEGRFPSATDPNYQDVAVYLRGAGSAGRTLRIPVRGNATQ